jgi:class 3 adenylate cyclase/tetratricopeptide (TPR) repeat protein
MTGIAEWLASKGLERYVAAFEAAEIDLATLALLSDDDLREIGLPLGPRRKILSMRHASDACPGERRQMTVMFVDLVDSTSLSTRFDPEIMGDLLASYKEAVATEVVEAGGTVAKFLGDGVLAYFGWPRAREDAAECAIYCALRIRDRIKLISNPAGEPLQCRTGIATGLVVVGGTTGSGNAREDAVAGEVLNLAARLQTLVEPDGICVSARVRELVGQLFEFEFGGEHSLRGFDAPIAAWHPLREIPHTNRFAAKRAIKRAFVGRGMQLASLSARWGRVLERDGQSVVILGEAGIGKSRLLEELHAEVGVRAHAFACWQCSAFHQTKPLYPVIERIARAANITETDDAPTRLAKLATLLNEAEMPVESALPLFAGLLSLPAVAGASSVDLTPTQRRSATIAAIVDWIRRVAEDKPLLLVLEDAHWADATTLEVMRLLINGIASIPLMFVITGRPEFAPPLSESGDISTIRLERLNDEACEGLIREIIATGDVQQSMIETILTHSDGNPLYVEELTAAVLGSGFAERQIVPDTLQGSLMARLDQLGEAKRTAQLCAVLGRRFGWPLLAEVHDGAPALLETNLSLLVAHDVLHPVGPTAERRYQFKHALLRDAAYESLLLTERRRLHERCGRTLEQRFSEVVQSEPELLALHFRNAGLASEATDYLERAGDRSSESASYIEAIASYRDALLELVKLPEAEARDWRELKILLKLGPALSIIDGAQCGSVREVYERAETLGRQVGDLDSRFKALWGLWYNANVGHDYSKASEFADQLVELSEQSHDDAHMLEALHCRWSSALFRGECATTISDSQRGSELYRPDRHHRLAAIFGGHDSGVCAGGCGGSALVSAGQLDAGIRTILDSISLAEALHHPHSIAHALMCGLNAAVTGRDYDNLEVWGARLSDLAETYNFPPQRAIAAFFLEWRKAQSGEANLECLRSTFDAVVALGPFTLLYTALFAEELLRAGEAKLAIALIDDLLETPKSSFGFYLPEVHRVRGECLVALGRNQDASEELGQAAKVATEQGSELFGLRASLALLKCCESDDRRDSAIAALRRSLATIGKSKWPEIVAAREYLELGTSPSGFSRTSRQSASRPKGPAKASLPKLPA